MEKINKIFESLKLLVPVVYAIGVGIWNNKFPLTQEDALQLVLLLQTIVAIIAGLIGGSGVSRLRTAYKQEKKLGVR